MYIRANATFHNVGFARLEALIVPKLQAGIHDACAIVLDVSRQEVPVDTGELASSGGFTVELKSQQVIGTVEYGTDHAAYNEFGTGRRGSESGHSAPGISYDAAWPGMPGHPYLRPALDSTRGEVLEAVKDALE